MTSSISDRTLNSSSKFWYELGGYPIDDVPKLNDSELFVFSLEDVLGWVLTMRKSYNQFGWMKQALKNDPLTVNYIKKHGRPKPELVEIRSLCEHTERLTDRFNCTAELPVNTTYDLSIHTEDQLMEGVSLAILKSLKTTLWLLVTADRHKKRNYELYKLACSLRLFAETLEEIVSVLTSSTVDGSWVLKKRGLIECYQKGINDNVANMRHESIPSEYLDVFRTIGINVTKIGIEVSKVIPPVRMYADRSQFPINAAYQFIRNPAHRVLSWPRLPANDHLMELVREAIPKRDWSEKFSLPPLPHDNHHLERIREAIPQLRTWSEEFSKQADDPPANPLLDLLAGDAERQCVLRSTAIERMDDTKRFLRLSRDRILNSQVIAPATNDLKAICREYLAEVTNQFNLQSEGTFSHRVPHLPNICDEVSALQFLGDLDCWLAKSILELRAERPSDTSTPTLTVEPVAPAMNSDQTPVVATPSLAPPALLADKPTAKPVAPAGVLEQLPVVATPDTPAVAAVGKAKKKRTGIRRVDAETLVHDWLLKHAKDDPKTLTVRRIKRDTGVSVGQIPKLKCWIAFEGRRKELRNSEPRTVPLDEIMIAKVSESQAKDRKRNG